MPLGTGDLPPGVHRAGWAEIGQRFGIGSNARVGALATLKHLHELASRTGALRNFYVFGSFVSAVPAPRDVDVVLIMSARFRVEDCPPESRSLFSHAQAQARYGASIFWVRAEFERLLVALRKTARPEEWPDLSSGYRLEIERMQREILDYLVQASPGAKRTTAA
jgi:hypothetical protein